MRSTTSRVRQESDGFDMNRLMKRLKSPTSEKKSARRPSLIVDNTQEGKADLADIDTDKIVPRTDVWPLPGFAPMTRISTSFGEVHAIALRVGDMVRTARGDLKPIVWLDRISLDDRFLNDMPDANPIKITADSFGRGLPKVDVMLSPRQTIGLNPRINMPEGKEAADLMQRPGVFRQPETGLSYTMFHLGEPQDVLCEGIAIRIAP